MMFNGNAAHRIEVPERRLELVRDPEVIEAIRQGPRGGLRAARGPRVGLRGVLDEDFLPTHIPGCVLFCCGDTARFPSAIVVPADPLVDADMEAAGVTNWTNPAAGVSTKETGTPHSGTQCLRVSYTSGVVGYARSSPAVFAVGNTYRVRGYNRVSAAGVEVPQATDAVNFLWTGSPSTSWQAWDTGNFVAAGTTLNLYCGNLAAGRYTEWDDITIECLNCSQFTDQSGAEHHLLQATAAKQPLVVASGSGAVLRFDGTADYLKTAAFTLDQPCHYFLLFKRTVQAGQCYYLDGDTAGSSWTYQPAGSTSVRQYAGTNGAFVVYADAAWSILDSQFSGATSAIAANGSAPTVANAGTANPGGVTLGSAANGAGNGLLDCAAVIVYSRALSESERQRVIRYLRRLAQRLGITL